MNLQSQLTAVRRRWWIVLASVMVGLAAAGLITVNTQPRYDASVTFFFVTTPADGLLAAAQGSAYVQQRTKSYAALLTSDRLAQSVAAEPGLGVTAGEVQARLTALTPVSSVLVDASFSDRNQARALRVVEVVAVQFVKLVQSIETPTGAKNSLVKVEVMNGPRVTPEPVAPDPARNLVLGGLLGLFAGVAAAIVRAMVDRAVRTAEVLSRLTSAPVIGEIPYDKSMKSAKLIVGASAKSPRAEAMRKLRTNLRFVDLQEPARVVAVTSAVQGEGKTTAACNLAIALCEAGWQVLLVDADLRRPQVTEYLGLTGRPGLTDVLLGEVELTDAVQSWGDRSLLVLPAGPPPPNPSELLGSKGMADLLASLRESADIVLIDTAPLLAVTDGVVVSVQADGALLVARYGSTSQAQLTAATQALRAVDARLLGCVLNGARRSVAEGRYYPSYLEVPAQHAVPGRRRAGVGPEATDVPAQNGAGAVAAAPTDATQEFSQVTK
ncbi:polysaccharide biosynthesis tyrosine autokinase [Micromonospora zhanjiangensis]|uniref:Polysaccharide biosynthesis tyrosine autokinase n=1 Tax=Micromonospora zhanjiangensis TaxID=1522057 RepID=A0ABV8KRF3_9ACTN